MRRMISVFISIVMLVCVISPAASAADSCNCGQSPIIYVSGLGSASLVRDAGTENEQQLWKIDTKFALGECAKLVPSLSLLLADGNWDAFGDDLIGVIDSLFGDLALDGNGVSSDRVTYELREYTNTEHGLGKDYYFAYDFRISPFENAGFLDEAIRTVKELTGHDKVSIRASSMGGVITMAYLARYGTDNIDKIIFVNCPILGTEVAGELFTKQLEINKEALLRYGTQALPALDNDPLSAFLYLLIVTFDQAGMWDELLSIADVLVEKLGDRIFDEALIPIFGSMPGIWAFVSDKYFEDAKLISNNPETQSGILSQINDYHYSVMDKAEEILRGAQNDGVCIYVLAGYDMQRTPIVPSYMNDSDGTVDTKYASIGATVAPLGEELPEGYVQAVGFGGVNYISPDNHIDASTCVLPESTWFIKDMLHCNNHDGHGEFYRKLFESDTQLTVFSDPQYPQFLQNDRENQTFYPVVPNEDFTAIDIALTAPNLLHFTVLLMEFLMQLKTFITAVKS